MTTQTQTQSRPRRESLLVTLPKMFPDTADFRAYHPANSPFPDAVRLWPARNQVVRELADRFKLDPEHMPAFFPVSRWNPTPGTREKPVYYVNCRFRFTGKVFSIMPPNWRKMFELGQGGDFIPLDEPLQLTDDGRGMAAKHKLTGQLILPSRVRGFELEVPANGLFQPGEVYIRGLLHQNFLLACPPSMLRSDTSLVDVFVDDENGEDYSQAFGLEMWGRILDFSDFYGVPRLDDFSSRDRDAIGFNIIAAFEGLMHSRAAAAETFFTLVKEVLNRNASGGNPEISPELLGIAAQLEREFFTAVTMFSRWVDQWYDNVAGPKLRKAISSGYQFSAEELVGMVPASIHRDGRSRPLSKPVALMTIEEIVQWYWQALRKRAAKVGIAPSSSGPSRPTRAAKERKAKAAQAAAVEKADPKTTRRFQRATAKPPSDKKKATEDRREPGRIVMQAGDASVPTAAAVAVRRAGLAPEDDGAGEQPPANNGKKPREEFFAKCGHCGERDVNVPGLDCKAADGKAPNHFCNKCRKNIPSLKKQQREAAAERRARLSAATTTDAPTTATTAEEGVA